MAEKAPPLHLRLPQRADAVAGKEQQPGAVPPLTVARDPRTSSQDPVLAIKTKFV
jgi:hypothetical protein